MKYTRKSESPAAFEAWKSSGTQDWQPTFKSLRNPEKAVLQHALLLEQGHVCCYCGRSIDASNSHLEHFRPQKHFSNVALDYQNLHASCYRMPEPAADHCGHHKADGFDDMLHISPLDPRCERRYLYAANGVIAPADPADEQARYMIELLGLNSPSLRNARQEILLMFDNEFFDSAMHDDLARLSEAFRAKDDKGALPNYGHVAACFAEQYLG